MEKLGEMYESILLIIAMIVGVGSAAYFYFSADIFINLLKRPLQLVSFGMFLIDIGVVLVSFISYEASKGVFLSLFSIPLSTYFYVLYIVGSLLIALGAMRFKRKPVQQIA